MVSDKFIYLTIDLMNFGKRDFNGTKRIKLIDLKKNL